MRWDLETESLPVVRCFQTQLEANFHLVFSCESDSQLMHQLYKLTCVSLCWVQTLTDLWSAEMPVFCPVTSPLCTFIKTWDKQTCEHVSDPGQFKSVYANLCLSVDFICSHTTSENFFLGTELIFRPLTWCFSNRLFFLRGNFILDTYSVCC